MSGSITAMSFSRIPRTQLVPGVGIELNTSRNTGGSQQIRALLIGRVTAGAPWASAPFVNQPALSTGVKDASIGAGYGSELALMVRQAKARYPSGEFWVLPLVDDPAASQAIGGFNITGTATAAGALPLYVDGQLISVPVNAGDTGAVVIAAALAAASVQPDLPTTFATGATLLGVGAKNKGLAGNDIDLRVAYRGTLGGETIPPGLTVTVQAMAGGAVNSSLSLPLLNLADMRFEVIVTPFTDSASLDALGQLMNESAGRWAWNRKLYGHVYGVRRAALGAATTFGVSRNDPHVTVMPINSGPNSPARCAAEIGAAVLERVAADPARPLQLLETNILPPASADRFVASDRQVLLFDGLGTFKVTAGIFYIERLVTTYQQNAAGAPDDSYRDAETMHTLGAVCRDLDAYMTQRFIVPGFKLVADNVKIPGGAMMVNPAVLKATLDTRYRYLCEAVAWCQDPEGFAKESYVELPGGGRANLYAPVRLMGQLRFMAIQVAFNKPT